jgi:uncharacterized protein (DUF488 family)
MDRIFTIGYEGASLADFIKTLKASGVSTLLDVREIPISRRKGFSKKALREAIDTAGMVYRHERALGSPKRIRDALHCDKNYEVFFMKFDQYLRSQSELLSEISASLAGGVALMCYERDPKICHRSVVANHLQELTGLRPTHLGVKKYGNDGQTVLHPGQGVPATQPAI